jgi:hypothetical protein
LIYVLILHTVLAFQINPEIPAQEILADMQRQQSIIRHQSRQMMFPLAGIWAESANEWASRNYHGFEIRPSDYVQRFGHAEKIRYQL